MQARTYIIDTFTSQAFKGNPTSVCYINNLLEDVQMQVIANEFNLPVTAFVQKRQTSEYTIRYFTPLTEIPACGHATLAAAKVVQLQDNCSRTTFYTNNDIAIITTCSDKTIMMGYPKYDMEPTEVSKALLDSLYIKHYKSAGYCKELETLFIEVMTSQMLRSIQPDYTKLVNSSHLLKEVVVTAPSDKLNYDYLLRSFCPWIGINEDPVTGSVHSVLAQFWGDRLGKKELNVYQASQRGGKLVIKRLDDKVEIGGETVVVLEGKIIV